jgi:uncharacterized protein (TIGR00299 family) protein
MHIHLDPVGGIAGDMFAAALLDLRPELEAGLRAALDTAGFTPIVSVAREDFNDGVLSGSRFTVTPSEPERHDHHHRRYSEVVALFTAAEMPAGVRVRALDMFRVLGEAEASVHGKALQEVAFHEVGAWDSIADVMAAAWLIEALDADSWSCAAIPIGGGRVHTAHGELAVPAPATTILLHGLPMHDDGRPGERVTPTGAAILKHLQPDCQPLASTMTLQGSGSGFGTRKLRDMSNVLRALAFAPVTLTPTRGAGIAETLSVCEFEVDDQTPEDLAVGLAHLRAIDAVVDVIQAPVLGKKGRMAMHVRVLARPEALDAVLDACLDQTSTLGVRHHTVQRTSLAREEFVVAGRATRQESAGSAPAIRAKQVTRPDGNRTRKAEMDDLARVERTRAAREQLRRDVETTHPLADERETDNDD